MDKKTNKISTISALIAGALICFLIVILGTIDNVKTISVRHDNRVVQVENYSCDRVEKEDTPAGVVDIYRFKLSDNLPEGQHLAFYTMHQYTEVYIDNKLIYSVSKSDVHMGVIGLHFR